MCRCCLGHFLISSGARGGQWQVPEAEDDKPPPFIPKTLVTTVNDQRVRPRVYRNDQRDTTMSDDEEYCTTAHETNIPYGLPPEHPGHDPALDLRHTMVFSPTPLKRSIRSIILKVVFT